MPKGRSDGKTRGFQSRYLHHIRQINSALSFSNMRTSHAIVGKLFVSILLNAPGQRLN